MSSTLDDTEMTFNSLQRTNQKLASNPELSEHNKEVLEDFFKKARSGGSGDAILRDYSSRFNKLADHIDFKLDNPSREDLQDLYAKLNADEIKKNNGEKYSDYSKDKFDSALSKFYNWFIKKEGKGYNPSVHGPDLVEDLEMNIELSTEVDPDSLPTMKPAASDAVTAIAKAAARPCCSLPVKLSSTIPQETSCTFLIPFYRFLPEIDPNSYLLTRRYIV